MSAIFCNLLYQCEALRHLRSRPSPCLRTTPGGQRLFTRITPRLTTVFATTLILLLSASPSPAAHQAARSAVGQALVGALSAATTRPGAHTPTQIAIVETVSQFVRAQLATLPGQPSISVELPARTAKLPACQNLTAFASATHRLRARTSVGVRCAAPQTWSVYVPTHISLPGRYYVAVRPLAPGQTLRPDDLGLRTGNLLALPRGILLEGAALNGYQAAQRIASGQVVRSHALRARTTIQRGQAVTLIAQGTGFQIRHSAHALATGSPGQAIPVRTAHGQTLTATVQDGQTVTMVL